jgi:hypothetical protein
MEHNSSTQTSTFAGPASLFNSAWTLYFKHWTTIVPIFIIPSVAFYISNLLTISDIPALAMVSGMLSVLGFILSVPQNAAVIQSVHALARDEQAKPSILGEYSKGFALFWPLIWVMILAILILTGSLMALIVPAIIIGIYGAFYSFALVLDGKRGREAFVYSFELVQGKWLAVLGRNLFLGLAFMGFMIIFAGILFILRVTFALPEGSMALEMVNTVLDLILAAMVGPIAVAYNYYMYNSLKAAAPSQAAQGRFKLWITVFLVIGIIFAITAIAGAVAKLTNII